MIRAPHPSWIEIDLAQFRKNIALVRKTIGNCLLCLPVKANAYGHGLCEMAREAEIAGVDYLGVSCLQEGILLRRAKIAVPILVLGAIHEDQVDDLIEFDLEFTISSRFKANLVASRKKRCRVHLEVETGMQRTGMRCETALELFRDLQKSAYIEVAGIYSHLATGDGPDDPIAMQQIEVFQKFLEDPVFKEAKLITHIANSKGLVHFPASFRQMVRPGILCFGYLPQNAPFSLQGIIPCFSLKSKVSYFKVVEKGLGIGYGHTYKTASRTRIVTVPIGYGDGFLRAYGRGGSVLIRGKKFPIAGAICMDQFMVDVGDEEVYVGDEVVLIGKQGKEEIKLVDIAERCGGIPHEILSLLNDRIPRNYFLSPLRL